MKRTIPTSLSLALITAAAACSSTGDSATIERTETSSPSATVAAASPTEPGNDTAASVAEPRAVDPDDPLGLAPIPPGDEWPSRPGFPADPANPEPIGSTGGDLTDIITVDDPTTFACLESLGQGPEEILEPSKGAYEEVPDAHLFRAHYTDGTSIDIRVHPEVGTAAEIATEVDLYVRPLGQLPTVLRRDIGRFAIRLGDETATASYLEGISVQVGNMNVRRESNRLEETLFHESVHTGLDPRYAFGRSPAWRVAQDADGVFLTEYGRENPDQEDLAESMLYAYGALHRPDRFPADQLSAITERIPNRIAFITRLLPPDEDIFQQVGPAPECS